MVQDITKDIKSLDCAKKNLTASITALRRMQMLGEFLWFSLIIPLCFVEWIVSAVEQLRLMTGKKQFNEIYPLLQVPPLYASF